MATSESSLILVVTRVFKSDPEYLFDAWTKPELARQWFHAGENWTTPVAEMDFKPGGAWKVTMQRPDGHQHHALGEYRVIERPNRLVFTWHPYGDKSVETLVTLRFKGLPDGTTELTLTHEGLRNDKEKADHTNGWNGCLASLGKLAESKGGKA